MQEHANLNYLRIEQAICFIKNNFKAQPSLAEIAAEVHLSPDHFQRLFTDWAGVSPKKFLQYITIEYAKNLLKEQQNSLQETAYAAGLSGSSRLHDLFINIEKMTPGEYKNGGQNLVIEYRFATTPFGLVIVASTPKGICYIAFGREQTTMFAQLKQQFANAHFIQTDNLLHQSALAIFQQYETDLPPLKITCKSDAFST